MTRKAENRPWQGLGGLTILVISILRWVISRQYSSIENLAVRQSWLHGIPYSMLAVFEKQCFFHSGGCCASGHLVVKYSTKKLRLPAWRVTDRTCSSYIGARSLCTDRALATPDLPLSLASVSHRLSCAFSIPSRGGIAKQ